MTEFQKGYIAYNWLEPSGLDRVASRSQNPEEFKRGYWQADNEMLQLKEDQERLLFEQDED